MMPTHSNSTQTLTASPVTRPAFHRAVYKLLDRSHNLLAVSNAPSMELAIEEFFPGVKDPLRANGHKYVIEAVNHRRFYVNVYTMPGFRYLHTRTILRS